MEGQIFQAPDFITPITAWRFWRMKVTPVTRRVQLWSLASARVWSPGKYYEAECIARGVCSRVNHDLQDVPALPPAQCGIYGYKTTEEALLDLQGKLSPEDAIQFGSAAHGGIFGQVKLWGTIQQHRHGYRAQFAYPASFVMGICDKCHKPFPVDEIRFLKREKVDPSVTFSVPVFAVCLRHREGSLEEFPELAKSLAKVYKITVGEKTLVP